MAYSLLNIETMNLLDISIIYLAVGAPFAVYYFFQYFRRRNSTLWFKAALVFFGWIFYLLFLLREKSGKNLATAVNLRDEIALRQNHLEKLFPADAAQNSFFEFRETLERYAGLMLIESEKDAKLNVSAPDFFIVGGTKNPSIAAACLARRNRTRLFFHQTRARRNFLSFIGNLIDKAANKTELENAADEFAAGLNDNEAVAALEKIFAIQRQIAPPIAVRNTEKDIWKPVKHKPLTTN